MVIYNQKETNNKIKRKVKKVNVMTVIKRYVIVWESKYDTFAEEFFLLESVIEELNLDDDDIETLEKNDELFGDGWEVNAFPV